MKIYTLSLGLIDLVFIVWILILSDDDKEHLERGFIKEEVLTPR